MKYHHENLKGLDNCSFKSVLSISTIKSFYPVCLYKSVKLGAEQASLECFLGSTQISDFSNWILCKFYEK